MFMIQRFNRHLLILCFSSFMLSACGVRLPYWDELRKDPLDFMTAKEKETQAAQAPAPPGSQAPPSPGTAQDAEIDPQNYLDPTLDEQTRIARIEEVIIALQKDVEKIKGGKSTGTDSMRTAAENQPIQISKPVETSPVPKGPRDMANKTQTLVTGVRVGKHANMIRIVFDVTDKTSYTADLDNNERILVVEFPHTRWSTPAKAESFGKMPVIQSYRIDPYNGDQGHVFVLQLKQSTRILSQKTFPALSGSGSRIVIDLQR